MQPNSCSRSSNVASGSTSAPPTRQYKNGRSRNGNQASAAAAYYRKAHSVSPQQQCFASSQFCNSPSARKIPLPPLNWIIQTTEQSSTSSSGSTSPSHERNENITGVRVCPLQLIAAVASS